MQAFGTGHSQAFAMEIAGRAGGLIPTNRIALRDVVLLRRHGRVGALRRGVWSATPIVVDELLDALACIPADVFIIASNSGVNGSIVGMALRPRSAATRVIAVTSLEHTNAVTPKHPSGKRLSEVADVVIDNLAPYGDTTIDPRRRRRRRRRLLDHRGASSPSCSRSASRSASPLAGDDPAHLPLGEHPRR